MATLDEITRQYKAQGYRSNLDVSSIGAKPVGTPAVVGSDGLPQKPSALGGFARGLGKSALGLFQGVGQIGRGIQKGISKGVEAVTGIEDFGLGKESLFDIETEAGKRLEEATIARTPSEKVGKFVGEVVQFVVPATRAFKLTKGLGIFKTATGQALSDATVTALQEGRVDKSSIDAAILGAIFPIAGKGLSIAKKKLTPDMGAKIINSLIKPLLPGFSYGKNPGKAVAEAGITANSLEDLGAKISTARQQVGKEIGEKIAGSTKVFDMTDGLKPIDDAITEAQKNPRTNAAIISRLNDLRDDLLRVTTKDGEEVIGRKLTNLSADEVFELKKEIGDLTRWTGNATDDAIVNKALKQSYGVFKGALDDAIEGIKPLNEKYANFTSAEIATTYRDKIAARQNLISLSATQAGGGTALTAIILSGGAVIPAILLGTTVGALTQALKTPAVKTRIAKWLASASKEEIESVYKQAPFVRSILQASLFGE